MQQLESTPTYYKVTAPDGKNHRFSNLLHFCSKYNLRYRPMLKLITDRKVFYKGWRNGWNQGVYEPNNKISLYVEEKIVKLYPECSPMEIAERFDISFHTVIKYLKKHDVYVYSYSRNKLTKEQLQELWNLHPAYTPTEIAGKLNIHYATVIKYLKRAGAYQPRKLSTKKEGYFTRDVMPSYVAKRT